MTKSVGVKLWDRGRLYYYNPTELDLDRDTWILVKTEHALTPARVFLPSRPLLPMLEAPSLRPIVRKATPKDEERIRSGGCEAYISKPISVMTFLETVRRYIGHAKA